MSHFCLLRDAKTYVAHDWNPLADSTARAQWLEEFQQQFAETMKHAAARYGRKATRQIAAAQQQFSQAIEQSRAAPAPSSRGAAILELCRLREKALRDNGLGDPYGHIKDRETRAAAQLYPALVRKLHLLPAGQKWLQTLQCVFAAEQFSLGAGPASSGGGEQADFAAAVRNVKPRPWLVDDYDRLEADLSTGPPSKWSKAVLFLDKAGADFVLGAMPLARELGLAGTKIVLAANELPSLKEITADEAAAIVEQLAGADDDLASLISAGMIEVVSTGSDLPISDLSAVSQELNEAAQGAELVVLLGDGRAVQTNHSAAFTVDSLKLALLSDPAMAQRIGGAPQDCLCKYEPLPGASAS